MNWRSPEKNFWRRFFFFWSTLAPVSLVLGLGLEHCCPWPREVLSSERLSLALALASGFFCVLGLGLEPCVFDSTSVDEFERNQSTMSLKVISSHVRIRYGSAPSNEAVSRSDPVPRKSRKDRVRPGLLPPLSKTKSAHNTTKSCTKLAQKEQNIFSAAQKPLKGVNFSVDGKSPSKFAVFKEWRPFFL